MGVQAVQAVQAFRLQAQNLHLRMSTVQLSADIRSGAYVTVYVIISGAASIQAIDGS
jgi:hypothetical protein